MQTMEIRGDAYKCLIIAHACLSTSSGYTNDPFITKVDNINMFMITQTHASVC